MDAFKFDDLHSAKRDEAAKPSLRQKPVSADAPVMNFGQFAAKVDPTQAQCVPATNVNFKTTLSIGKALPDVASHRKVS